MKRIYTKTLLLLALGGSLFGAPREIDEILRPLRRRYDMPGVAAAVVVGDRIVASGAVGVRKEGSGVSVTVDDAWQIGSCVKSMTATVAGRLVERGVIRWETTLFESFGHLVDLHPDYVDVTLDQLLSHSAGVPDDPTLEQDQEGDPYDELVLSGIPLTEQRFLFARNVLSRPPQATPGTKMIYSNAGYIIAGAMLEGATGKSWEALMEEELFEPLGMHSAGFGAPATPGRVDGPWAHGPWNGPIDPRENLFDQALIIGPAGHVHCSIEDFARYATVHLHGEPRATNGGEYLTPETFRKLHAAMIEVSRLTGTDYALGWGNGEHRELGPYLIHTGSNGVFYAAMVLLPERNGAIVAATNSLREEGVHRAIFELGREYLEEPVDILPVQPTWSLTVGAGGGLGPTYAGAGETGVDFLPLLDLEYRRHRFGAFVGLTHGLGVTFREERLAGLEIAVGVDLVEGRDPNEAPTKELLEGTPTLESNGELFASVGFTFELFALSSTVSLATIDADYDEADRRDARYDSVCVDFDVTTALPFTESLFLTAALGTTWMNGDHAEALYGVLYTTDRLDLFDADGGFETIHGSLGLVSLFTPRLGLVVEAEFTYPLDSAADSPITERPFYPGIGATLFYQWRSRG